MSPVKGVGQAITRVPKPRSVATLHAHQKVHILAIAKKKVRPIPKSSYRQKNVTPHSDAGPESALPLSSYRRKPVSMGPGRGGGYARHVQLPTGRQHPIFITSCGLHKAIVIPMKRARTAPTSSCRRKNVTPHSDAGPVSALPLRLTGGSRYPWGRGTGEGTLNMYNSQPAGNTPISSLRAA